MSQLAPIPPRPLGQSIVAGLLFTNAAICTLFALAILALIEAGVTDYYFPVAVVFGYSPALALASLAAPVLILRRSALGMILAWLVAVILILDVIFCIAATTYLPLALLKAFASFSLGVALIILLSMPSTYVRLNPQSYGFPVITRMSAMIPSSRTPSPANVPPSDVILISEVPAMNSFRRSITLLRWAAWLIRIPALLIVFLNLLTTAWFAFKILSRMLNARSGFGPGPAWESGMDRDLQSTLMELWISLIPALIAGVIVLGTFFLTALAENINVNLFLAAQGPRNRNS